MTEVPATLRSAGTALWESVAGKYALRPDELATLEDACLITDMVAALTQVWVEAGAPSITKGSMGQEVIHPLIGEIRAQRMSRNALFRQLKLPDDAAGVEVNQQRDAAAAKWSAGKGRGA